MNDTVAIVQILMKIYMVTNNQNISKGSTSEVGDIDYDKYVILQE